MPTQDWNDLIKEAAKHEDDFKPIPAQEYDFVVSKVEPTTSQRTGKQGWKTQNKVVDGEHKGRVVFDQHYISPESPTALNIFFGTMKVLGLDAAFFATNPTPEAIAQAMVGKVFHGTVVIEPDNRGEPHPDRNAIKNYKTASEFAKHQALSVATSANAATAPTSAPPTPTAAPVPQPVAAAAPQPPAAPPAPAAPAPAAPAPAAAPAAPEAPPAAPAPEPAAAPAAPQQDSTLPPPPPPPQF